MDGPWAASLSSRGAVVWLSKPGANLDLVCSSDKDEFGETCNSEGNSVCERFLELDMPHWGHRRMDIYTHTPQQHWHLQIYLLILGSVVYSL